jgi:hypothetical protein
MLPRWAVLWNVSLNFWVLFDKKVYIVAGEQKVTNMKADLLIP